MSKYKSNKRKIFVAKWPNNGILVYKTYSIAELLEEVVARVPNIDIKSITVYENPHSQNEVCFNSGV